MPTVVPAEGPLLQRLVAATPQALYRGLNRKALVTFDAAQAKTTWALHHQRRFALVEGDQVLAGAARYDLAGMLDQQPLRICALGSVFGVPDPAGAADHAVALVDQLLKDATRDGADLALMFRMPETAGPRPQGFEVVPLFDAELTVAESSRHGAPMTLVRGGEDRDVAAIAAMGRARAARFRFHLDRDVDLVRYTLTRSRLFAGLRSAGSAQLIFVIAEEGITAAAYVVISVSAGTWTIEECGDRDASGARVGALLQALIAREPVESRPVIRGWLPPGFVPPQVTISSLEPAGQVLLARVLSARVPRLTLSSADVLYWRNDMF